MGKLISSRLGPFIMNILISHGLARTVDCLPIGGVEQDLMVLGVLVVVPPNDKLRLNLDPPNTFTGEQYGDVSSKIMEMRNSKRILFFFATVITYFEYHNGVKKNGEVLVSSSFEKQTSIALAFCFSLTKFKIKTIILINNQ